RFTARTSIVTPSVSPEPPGSLDAPQALKTMTDAMLPATTAAALLDFMSSLLCVVVLFRAIRVPGGRSRSESDRERPCGRSHACSGVSHRSCQVMLGDLLILLCNREQQVLGV